MLIEIRADACLVAGAGAPSLAPRPSIAIRMYRKMINICTPNMLCRCSSSRSILFGIGCRCMFRCPSAPRPQYRHICTRKRYIYLPLGGCASACPIAPCPTTWLSVPVVVALQLAADDISPTMKTQFFPARTGPPTHGFRSTKSMRIDVGYPCKGCVRIGGANACPASKTVALVHQLGNGD